MLKPLGCFLAFGPQSCAFGPAHLIHCLIQMARDMKTIEYVQSLAGLGAMSRILCKHPRRLKFRAGYTGCTRAEDKALRRRNLSADSAAGIGWD